MLLTVVEPATSTQLDRIPTLMGLVWTWSRQPMWSAGQLRFNWLPIMVKVILVRLVLTVEMTRNVPSVASVLVFQPRPAPGVAGKSDEKGPAYFVALNSLKVLPEVIVPASVTIRRVPP